MNSVLVFAQTWVMWVLLAYIYFAIGATLLFVVLPMTRYWLYHRPVEDWAAEMAARGRDVDAQRTLTLHADLLVTRRVAKVTDSSTKTAVVAMLDKHHADKRDVECLEQLYDSFGKRMYVPRVIRELSQGVESYKRLRKLRPRFTIVPRSA